MAEYVIVPVDQLVRIPMTMSFEDAAGGPTAAGTAWQALFEVARLTSGQTILVHAGAGGVGIVISVSGFRCRNPNLSEDRR